MKEHHRNIKFRPPRKRKSVASDGFALYRRFFGTYMLPHRWRLLLCILLVSVNACSVYLISFYGRVVVDKILIVKTAGADTDAAPVRRRIWQPDRERGARKLPRQGLGRRIDLGLTTLERPPGAGRWLMALFVTYMLTRIALNYLGRFAQRTRISISQRVTAQLREDMHRKILELSLSFHQAYNPGQLLSRIVSDVGMVQQQMMTTVISLAQSLAMIVVGGLILITADWRLACIVLVVVPLYAVIYRRARPKVREITKELRHTNSCLFGYTSQKFDGMKAIQAYGREGQERLNYHRLTACFLRDALLQQRLSAKLSRSSTLISAVGSTLIFLLGARFVMDARMSLGEMMFVYSATMSLFSPVLQLATVSMTFNRLFVILQRVIEVLDRPLEIVDAPDAVDFPRPVKNGIVLKNVRFTYVPDADVEPALRNINLTIPAGSWLCVMGASGCGKTTLLYLLTRLYEPTSGEILIDGVPLGKIRVASLRRSVGFVPQEAEIFSGTVRENICYGLPDAEPQQIMAAAKAAELHDFIVEMPVQYETLLDQKGTSLSGGQRQRLSLARALLTDPDVLILDDCTSALDADTEHRIQTTLARILVGKTSIIVSQRVSMAKRCHRICTIEDGVIREFGTHNDLLRSGGFYARLHAQQTE